MTIAHEITERRSPINVSPPARAGHDDAILKIRDDARWSDALAAEAADRRHLEEIVDENSQGER